MLTRWASATGELICLSSEREFVCCNMCRACARAGARQRGVVSDAHAGTRIRCARNRVTRRCRICVLVRAALQSVLNPERRGVCVCGGRWSHSVRQRAAPSVAASHACLVTRTTDGRARGLVRCRVRLRGVGGAKIESRALRARGGRDGRRDAYGSTRYGGVYMRSCAQYVFYTITTIS